MILKISLKSGIRMRCLFWTRESISQFKEPSRLVERAYHAYHLHTPNISPPDKKWYFHQNLNFENEKFEFFSNIVKNSPKTIKKVDSLSFNYFSNSCNWKISNEKNVTWFNHVINPSPAYATTHRFSDYQVFMLFWFRVFICYLDGQE